MASFHHIWFMCIFVHCTFGEFKINLNGKWVLEDGNGTISTTALVPGSVHTALMSKGIIGDPYYRFNDLEYRWILYRNWTFSRKFEIPENYGSGSTVQLVCDGLDTVANVFINGELVGNSNNMFLRYIYDIGKFINSGENIIMIEFESAVSYAARQAEAHWMYDVPPDCNPPEYQGFCHTNFIRKEQSSFSWDWGPAFAPVGIWRNISVVVFQGSVIQDVVAIPSPSDSANVNWSLNVTTYLETGNKSTEGSLVITLPKLGVVNKQSIILKPGSQTAHSVYFDVPKAETWWPIGYGKQPLYVVSVSFVSSSGEVSTKNVTIGFRKVQVVQDDVPGGIGNTFYFKINDQYIFLKGTNWIPVDAFQERVTVKRLENLLQSATDANMNTMRVWGGGIYEKEAFYRLADEKGILIWQDVMFACAMYPTGEKFLSTVKKEIEYQVRRLSNHPSVVVWGANNENEKALRQNWYGTNNNFSLYKADYVKLYISTVMEQYSEQYNQVPIISSSPTNGVKTEEEGWVAKNPADPLYGDIHYYNYNADCWNVSIYVKPRFASEYGFQSLSSFSTMSNVSEPSDWSYNSNFSLHRQHHSEGNTQMLSIIREHFSIPVTNDSLTDYKNIIYLSQISQAMCIKIETEHYRRHQSDLDENNYGMTRGALYWQLNDIWQAPTWSSTEYGGKWKMLHYFAKEFFEPVLASGYVLDSHLYVYVISDLVTALTNAVLTVKVWSWDSFTPLLIQNVTFDLKPQSSALVFSIESNKILTKARCQSLNSCFFTFDVIMKKSATKMNPLFISSFFDAQGLVQDPHIQINKVSASSKNTFQIEIQSTAIAPYMWLDVEDIPGRFSHNGFIQLEPTVVVEFYTWEEVTLDRIKQALTVRSLTSKTTAKFVTSDASTYIIYIFNLVKKFLFDI